MSNLIRTDDHRPSAIVPDDYQFVACAYLKIESLGDALFLQEQRERIARHFAKTGGSYSTHEHGGNCHICGSVNLIYSIVYYHAPSNTYIRCGSDCAEKLDLGGQREFNKFRAAVQDALQAKAGKAKAQKILAESGLSRAWEIAQAYGPVDFYANPQVRKDNEEQIIADIVSKLVKYGSISVNQGAFLGKLIDRIDARAERAAQRVIENEAAAPFPVTDKRIEIVGTVLSTKVQDSDFGSVVKMLVKAEAGWKIWVTCPGAPAKGDRVRFFAKVQPSRDDDRFGYGSRPTKFEILGNDDLRRIEQFRDRERNDETLTEREQDEFCYLLKQHPASVSQISGSIGTNKGCRD